MKEKPDSEHLCDEFGTGFDIRDLMCLNCDSVLFCYELRRYWNISIFLLSEKENLRTLLHIQTAE